MMIKQKEFFLSGNQDTVCNFLDSLRENFPGIHVLTPKFDLASLTEGALFENSSADSHLIVLFVDYPSLRSISEYLYKKVNPLNYILVLFHNNDFIGELPACDIFDQINVNSGLTDFNLFIKKLSTEIEHRINTLTLQYEVREFYKIGKSLSSEKDTVKLLEMIIDSSLSMTSSDAGTIYLVVDKENGNWSSVKNNNYQDRLLKFVIARNMSIDVNLQTSTTAITENSIFGRTVINGESIRIDDAYNIPVSLNCQHNHNFDLSTGYKTVSVLSIPMKDHEDNVIGVIQLINKKKSKYEKIDFSKGLSLGSIITYDYKDEMIMESLAGQAAIALENNLLYREMNELLELYKAQNSELEYLSTKILKAHEEERKRIAREIHDGPAQSVANLCLKLELCKKYFQINSFEKMTGEMEELNKNIRSSVKEIRTIIYDLKPSYLEDGLIKALENHFDMFRENSGLKLDFNACGDDSVVEYYLSSTIYRIAQESLSNIMKYAGARSITVDLDIGEYLSLIIIDDGKGFDTAALEEKKPHRLEGGFGLEGMMERVEIIRGNIEIKSAPGRGTKIIVKVPLTHHTRA